MKHLKYSLLFIFLFIITFLSIPPLKTKADMGPKPSISVEIKGMEGISYTVTFLGKQATPPYADDNYEDYMEYNPVMDYIDDEGYYFVGKYWDLNYSY